MKYTIVTLVFIISGICLNAQFSPIDTIPPDNPPISTDKKNSFTSIFYGQPGKAALYSLILPGAGQAYNKRWWKVPLVIGGEGAVVWYLTSKINAFQAGDLCWKSFLDATVDPGMSCVISDTFTITTQDDAFTRRQSARTQKELAWVFMGLAHLLNVVEAFVDRHLINFDTSEDISFQLNPNTSFSNFQLNTINIITFRIPITGKPNQP